MSFIKDKWFWAAIIWATVIFVLSIVSAQTIQKVWTINFASMDKVAHLSVYLILSIFIWKTFDNQKIFKLNIKTILVASGFGILMETVQFLFFPHRYFELFDIIANIIGSTLGVVVIHFLTQKK